MDEIIKMFGGAENIWNAIQTNAGKLGLESTKMMLELFYVLKSTETSIIDKTLIVTALGYQLLPEDALPRDKYGIFGLLDNVVTIGFAYNKIKSSVTPQIRSQVDNIISNWFDIGSAPQQSYIPNNENLYGGYTPNPINNQTQNQTNRQTMDGFLGNRPTPPQTKPIWDDDEDVVID